MMRKPHAFYNYCRFYKLAVSCSFIFGHFGFRKRNSDVRTDVNANCASSPLSFLPVTLDDVIGHHSGQMSWFDMFRSFSNFCFIIWYRNMDWKARQIGAKYSKTIRQVPENRLVKFRPLGSNCENDQLCIDRQWSFSAAAPLIELYKSCSFNS